MAVDTTGRSAEGTLGDSFVSIVCTPSGDADILSTSEMAESELSLVGELAVCPGRSSPELA